MDEEALARAWERGFTSGASRAMRQMSDEPRLPIQAVNPYRHPIQGPHWAEERGEPGEGSVAW